MNVHTVLRGAVGHVEERLETVKERMESVQLAVLFEVRLYLIEVIS